MTITEKDEYGIVKADLLNNEFLTTPRNNILLLGFLEAKLNGGYKRIVYDEGCRYITAIKKARNIRKIDSFFKKDFDKLTEDEILKYRDILNDNKMFCDKTLVKWHSVNIEGKETMKPYFVIVPTDRPLSYRTKTDYKVNFIEFWKYVTEYVYQENGQKLEDYTRYFKIKRPSDYSDVIVDYLDNSQLAILYDNIKNRDFRALLKTNVMSGARPCEIIKVKYGRGYNLYKNKEGKWVIHLPKIKKLSYMKYPFIIDMYEDDLYPYFDNLNLKDGDLVFKITDATYRKLMRYYTKKLLGRAYPPKIMRKTARMIRTNAGYSHDWINKLMGHSPNSKVQSHYTNHEGITNDVAANEKLKANQYPNLIQENEKLKLEIKALQEQQAHIIKILEAKKLYEEYKAKK